MALDAGTGAALRTDARIASILIPLASAGFVVLSWLYLRSLLAPYERLLETAESAPGGPVPPPDQDERGFLIARFEATIAALSDKERACPARTRGERSGRTIWRLLLERWRAIFPPDSFRSITTGQSSS